MILTALRAARLEVLKASEMITMALGSREVCVRAVVTTTDPLDKTTTPAAIREVALVKMTHTEALVRPVVLKATPTDRQVALVVALVKMTHMVHPAQQEVRNKVGMETMTCLPAAIRELEEA